MPTEIQHQPGETMPIAMGDPLVHATRSQFHPHGPNERFVLAVHPMGWDIIDGEFLPKVRRLVIAPGVNGTDGKGNSVGMQAGAMQGGWTLLRQTDPRVGDYGVGTRVRGGVHWHTKWEVLNSRAGIKLPTVRDGDAFDEWRRELVAKGVVDPPNSDFMVVHESRLRRRRDRREDSAKPYGRRQLRRAEEALEDLGSASAPGERSRKLKDSILLGNASKDRAICRECDDIDALRAALIRTKHKTVEDVIRERLEKLGA